MLKQAQLIGTTCLLLVCTTAGAVYLWWQSTPQYALIEARRGYLDKDKHKFNRFVDVASLTTAFTEEIIFEPAERTPNLTKLQRVVGLAAIHGSRTKIDNSLIFQIQRLVRTESPKSEHCREDNNEDKAKIASDTTDDATPSVGKKPKFSSIIRQQWKKEKERLKKATIDRMREFALSRPDTLISRIFCAPVGHRATAVKEILAECGFLSKNFRSYALEKKGSKFIATLTFLSPRINNLVTVKLELERLREGPFGRYRIARLVNFKQTLNHLKYDTDKQMQDLVTYGLQDLNGQTLASKAKEVIRNIGSSAARLEKERQEMEFSDSD
ncbi:MAG: hypothetical protein K2X93_03440 [Candidatus Obscuribacterales bacterium]|nr:hypothetical protein [Candidatus Obscuribacterales bacterium]